MDSAEIDAAERGFVKALGSTKIPVTGLELSLVERSVAVFGAMTVGTGSALLTGTNTLVKVEQEIKKAETEENSQASHKVYRPSGNGLVGGTGWIMGYNVQGADPVLIAKAQAIFKKNLELAGLAKKSESIDFARYNFAIGVATSTDIMGDLSQRIWRDHISNGDFSRENRPLYASLKGRQFNELGCHSNGAMVCLAAIESRDVKADHVVLYGPQVTYQSLHMWNDLLARGEIKSVDIYINKNDPVPPLSLAAAPMSPADLAEYGTRALLKPKVMTDSITELAPRIVVHPPLPCSESALSVACHDMTLYKTNTQNEPGRTSPR